MVQKLINSFVHQHAATYSSLPRVVCVTLDILFTKCEGSAQRVKVFYIVLNIFF